jgi:hypothetical protein
MEEKIEKILDRLYPLRVGGSPESLQNRQWAERVLRKELLNGGSSVIKVPDTFSENQIIKAYADGYNDGKSGKSGGFNILNYIP